MFSFKMLTTSLDTRRRDQLSRGAYSQTNGPGDQAHGTHLTGLNQIVPKTDAVRRAPRMARSETATISGPFVFNHAEQTF